MTKSITAYIPIAFIFSGFCLTWSGLYAVAADIETMQWYIYGSAMLALVGFILFLRKKKTPAELRLQAESLQMREKEKQLTQLENRLREDALELDKRILQFNQKLKTHHEWLEFPVGEESSEIYEVAKEIKAQDREVAQLLKQQSASFFENIKHKKYYKAGKICARPLWEDILSLIESVARIYNPHARQPLLQTSIEQLLRAINQISINLIVLLDRLPVNIKKRTLDETYGFIQKGVKGFEIYEKAIPYLDYIQPLYYFGRLALGANPIAMGATALAVEVGKTGTKQLTIHISEKYALRLLHETIAILANEMVSLFGGDYRHRDANWIYGAELTELVHQFPISREILQAALNETGNLHLRSEYDRLFLYRCLASHQSIHPEKYPDAFQSLDEKERQNIAQGLEKFYDRFIYGRTTKRIRTWKTGVESRLGCKLHLNSTSLSVEPKTPVVRSIFYSLASFLLEIKDREIAEIPHLLSHGTLLARLEKPLRSQILQDIAANPPMIYSYPDCEPDSELLSCYLEELSTLNVEVAPHDSRGDEIFRGVLHYFRLHEKAFQKKTNRQYAAFLEKQLHPDSVERKVKFPVARAALAALEWDQAPYYLFKRIALESKWEETQLPSLQKKRELWLLGTPARLILLAIFTGSRSDEEQSLRLWQGDRRSNPPIRFRKVKNRVIHDCWIEGGQWNREIVPRSRTPQAIVLSGSLLERYEKYFAPLLEFAEGLETDVRT